MDPRPATAADLPAIREVVTAAYARYLSRMDRPPAPMLADYGAAVQAAASSWRSSSKPARSPAKASRSSAWVSARRGGRS